MFELVENPNGSLSLLINGCYVTTAMPDDAPTVVSDAIYNYLTNRHPFISIEVGLGKCKTISIYKDRWPSESVAIECELEVTSTTGIADLREKLKTFSEEIKLFEKRIGFKEAGFDTIVHCPNCPKISLPRDNYCSNCGTKL